MTSVIYKRSKMAKKKKHIANRTPDVGLNDGVHFDEQLKVKKEKKETQLDNKPNKGKNKNSAK